MAQLVRTVLYDHHIRCGGKMVDFAGWEMPLQYSSGIIQEHLQTRRAAGLFDVSHMGRLVFRGSDALRFLQHSLTNDAAALELGRAQYTLIPTASGGAVDDAYLYRFAEDEYLLVVNAANRAKDLQHFGKLMEDFGDVQLLDRSADMAMISLQGPASAQILTDIADGHELAIGPRRNDLGTMAIAGTRVQAGRTGYAGEKVGFELFIPPEKAGDIWDLLVARGAAPVGLGARDTLRLEAGLPLYGHELGNDLEGNEIPIFACSLAKFAVSFSPQKGNFAGREALARQHEAFRRLAIGDYSLLASLPRRIMPLVLLDKAVARRGSAVYNGQEPVGYVTSGTAIPVWQSGRIELRAIALALIDSRLGSGQMVEVEVRGRRYRSQVTSKA